MEHGSWGLGGALLPHSIQGMGDIFFPLKVRKEGPLEDAIDNAKKKKKMKVWRWVSKNGFVANMVKNTKI